ncbi:TolB-like protein/class 3 adenylate cyclase/Tfp pilus assembly protein PilF [Bradyrhizobium sp. AZCC 2262]|uniref:adenylate/guanylate cyclase domain-containing protein n=1 Tax=Bradyrhizobium sp. AZCC 2262 TaxID=3117022 RepID=UPI002FF1E54D
MSSEHVERRLAAILAADVAGSCRLIGIDEEGTLAQLKALRKTLFDPRINDHRGRIVKNTGDGALVEFGSVVDAVRCAVQIQRGMVEQNIGVPQVKRLEFRIGIHVGDIVIDENDIFGDGVNIAVRLEGIAEPGGVCVSDDAYRQVRGKVEIACDDMGPQPLKNIAEPMRAWRVRLTGQTPSAVPSGSAVSQPLALPLPDKPSIAVLPFQNMSGDPEQEYFADGMVEEITTALSRIRWLFVVARNSSFTYKWKAFDIKQAGRELGVRYVLEGGIRKANNRIRITGQLIDAVTGAHIWADRFEGKIENVFDLQDRITISVVGAISPKLEQAKIERSRRKPTENLQAYDYYLQGLSYLYKYSKDANEQGLKLFLKAVELAPDFASPLAQLAHCYVQQKVNGWSADRISDALQACLFARKAIDQAKDDPIVLAISGFALAYAGGYLEEGAAYLEKATDLDPNLAEGWYWRGFTQVYLGEAGANEHFHQAIRLSPLDPRISIAFNGLAYSHSFAGNYDEASMWAEKAKRERPNYLTSHRIAMACLALSGKIDAAREACSKVMEMDPAQRISEIRLKQPFRRDADVAKLAEAFRLAGMPE